MLRIMEETTKNCLLIVDDERSNILALTHILSPDYTIYAAKNGRDAVEAAHAYLPDMILLDIVMPEMDGYEVITLLKGSERTRSIPVIFITGLNAAWDEEKGLYLGAVDYISKPFSTTIVKLRVQNQLQMLNYLKTIERLSMIDQLTDLPNRRSFDERLSLEWNMAIRNQEPISILILDLDGFKKYNDTYGHLQGDLALKAVAQIFMQEFKRSVDHVARWGGEEFIALLMNTDPDGALNIAEKVRASVENARILLADGQETKATISIGVNTEVPTPDSSVEDFIRYADDALYAAKRDGGNMVCGANSVYFDVHLKKKRDYRGMA
jgi:diguanylate cyclase (GGDEF)-like protein